jgi:hypothetical protein
MRIFPKAHMVLGRQFQSYGLGLLVNNSRQAQQGMRLAWNNLFGSSLSFETFAGGATYAFSSPFKEPGDSYLSARLAYQKPNYSLGGNWLVNGVGSESGWSVDAWARFWGGRELQVEYAKQVKDVNGDEFVIHNDPEALMATVDVWKGRNWALKGFYSMADAEYNPVYSSLNPYFEVYSEGEGTRWLPWELWLRNPLVQPNLEVIGGTLTFKALTWDWKAQYYSLDNKSNFFGNNLFAGSALNTNFAGVAEVPYDQLWALSVKRQVANGVDITCTYARQMLSDLTGSAMPNLDDAQLVMLGVVVGF